MRHRRHLVIGLLWATLVVPGPSHPLAANAEEHCRWDGTAPLCDGRCGDDETLIGEYYESDDAGRKLGPEAGNSFGATCAAGTTKAWCCTYTCPEGYRLARGADVITGPACEPINPQSPADLRKGGDVIMDPSPLQGTELDTGKLKDMIALSFDGTWSARADDVAYSLTMSQSGNTVDGSYSGANGSQGRLQGTVEGRLLNFSWWQTDGKEGVGAFVLSEDGQSFTGSYRFGNYTGPWNGRRQ